MDHLRGTDTITIGKATVKAHWDCISHVTDAESLEIDKLIITIEREDRWKRIGVNVADRLLISIGQIGQALCYCKSINTVGQKTIYGFSTHPN